MSKLDELIAKLCPEGVEYKELESLCSLVTKQTGFDYTNKIKDTLIREKTEGSIPYIQTKFFNGKNFNYDTDYYAPSELICQFPKLILTEKCLLFSIVGASIGNIGIVPKGQKLFLGGAICVAKILPEYDADFVYYFMSSCYGQKLIQNKVKGAGQATVTVDDIRKFKLPVPPLEVQREIVHILDEFTLYQNELAAELAARKKQYEYYKDSLLTFSENTPDVKWVKMSAIADIKRGIRVVKKDLNLTEGYPVFQNCLTPLGYYNEANFPAETAFVIGAGAAGEIGYSKGMFWAADDCYCLVCSESIIPRYAYYWLLKNQNYLFSRVRKASVPRLARNFIEDLLTPVPPLAEQQRIVDILDRFDKLCNDISEGLPAEIELRRKQYEYYRDKLLTFKEKEA